MHPRSILVMIITLSVSGLALPMDGTLEDVYPQPNNSENFSFGEEPSAVDKNSLKKTGSITNGTTKVSWKPLNLVHINFSMSDINSSSNRVIDPSVTCPHKPLCF
jgi:hypothetical protein